MQVTVETRFWKDVPADWLIVPVCETAAFTERASELDGALGGTLSRLREAGDLTGKADEVLEIRDARGIAARRVLLVGLGPAEEVDHVRWDRAIMTAARRVSEKATKTVAVALTDSGGVSPVTQAQFAAAALLIGSCGQALHKTEPSRYPIETGLLLAATATGNVADLAAAAVRGRIIGEAVNLTRELVNRPPQEIFPASLAERARTEALACGLECEILDEQQLEAERMGSLLAVARGSDRPPRLVVLTHRGDPTLPTLALCGKGVTFDSGGLSLKTNEQMLTMKCDMAGAATVLGAMTAVARLRLPVNLVGYLGLVENLPSGKAFKLGDVLTARNGVTIEVQNTDAEGRLVLADVLSYAVDRGADKLVDLATLTGSCVVALGEEVVGAFTNNAEWCREVLAAAASAGEDVWQLPMFAHYAELIKSDVADIKNVGGRWGGAITAAKFLERFVGEKPWVHLDIAGPAFASSSKPHREGGATGCMVRTLVELAGRFA